VVRAGAKAAAPPPGARPKAAPRKESKGLPDLDRVIHERMRLGIVSALAAGESLTFLELRRLLGASDGNLSVHARRLEEAGYVACTKSFEGRVPKTAYRLTAEGRRAFERYLSHLEAVIEHARRG
jgi:DNA-binding transcriptional ArsR family regulator